MITYIKDNEKEFEKDIYTHLRAHNGQFDKGAAFGERYFYLVEDNEMLAGVKIGYSWSWGSFKQLYYKDVTALQNLMCAVSNYFKDVVTGLKLYTVVEDRYNDFLKIGFEHKGILKGTERVRSSLYATCEKFDINGNPTNVVESEKPIVEYKLEEFDKKFNEDNNLDSDSERVSYVAFDGEVFAGGVVGFIEEDSMYIDLLVVRPEFKGNDIGTNLMSMIEEEATQKGVKLFSLGTAEFQARPFYEKLGYKVVMTLPNNPVGYECYTMRKLKED